MNHDRIKIVFLIDQLEIGGTEKQLIETILRLDRTRFIPYLICLRPSDYFYKVDIGAFKEVLGVKSLVSFNGFMKFIKFITFLKKQEIDILQTFFFDSTVFGVLAGKLGAVRKIIVSRRDLGFWYTPHLLLVLRFINRLVDGFLVNSKAIKECVVKRERVPPEKIDVIYNGIEIPPPINKAHLANLRTKLGISKNDRVVGIVANLNRSVKRVDLFVRAASSVLNETRDVRFIVIGDGHLRNQLMQLSINLELSENIIFAGRKQDVINYISLLDVGTLCSESEGLSNALLEYMCAGVPVVCTDVDGNKELIQNGKNGFLVPAGDHHALAGRILQLLSDKQLATRMGREGAKLVTEKYNWDKIIKEYEAYYQRLVGRVT